MSAWFSGIPSRHSVTGNSGNPGKSRLSDKAESAHFERHRSGCRDGRSGTPFSVHCGVPDRLRSGPRYRADPPFVPSDSAALEAPVAEPSAGTSPLHSVVPPLAPSFLIRADGGPGGGPREALRAIYLAHSMVTVLLSMVWLRSLQHLCGDTLRLVMSAAVRVHAWRPVRRTLGQP